MNMRDIILQTMSLDQRDPRAAATARKPQVQTLGNEGSPPAGLRTAEAGILASQRARIYELERFVEKLYDALPENPERAYDLVRAEYLAIHGPR